MPLPLPHFATTASAFLLGFPALFSIVNPLGASLIFAQVLADRTHADRAAMAGRVAAFSLGVLVVSLFLGAYVLRFFGISLGALRLAGGLVVAVRAWELLNAPEENEARREEHAGPASYTADAAFFPLTMPFTTGPGSIAVAIALGSERPADRSGLIPFDLGMAAAAAAVAACVWICYLNADRLMAVLGRSGTRVLTRLVAFLLLCIGVQIAVSGVEDLLVPLLAGAGRVR
jgi:multiple antibiotic resistance protein